MNIKILFVVFTCFLTQLSYSQTWLETYNGPGNSDDQVTAIRSDDSGNVYVTGFSMGQNTDYDIATIKYGADGQQIWVARYNGTANREDKAYGIVIDSDGFIFVCGFVSASGGNNEDLVLIKYNSAGTQIWAKTYNNENGSSDKALGIVVDNAGNYIYLTGYTNTGNNYDYLTVKYSNNGSFKWAKTFDNGQNSDDRALGIIVDSGDHIIVTGYSQGSTSSYDYFTIKYVSDGNVSWTQRYNGPSGGEDKAMGIVVDAAENYTITGYSMTSSSPDSKDIKTIQYNKNGETNWTKTYNGPDNLSDNAFGIIIDNSDNIIITGSTGRISTSEDFLTLKYDQSGIQKWAVSTNISENNSDIAHGVAVSNNGNVIYVVGTSIQGTGAESLSMAKYNSNGQLQQSILYPASGSASCVVINASNDLFLGGYYSNSPHNSIQNNDFITMDFQNGSLIIIGISGNNNNIPETFRLHQNYPNPFNPYTVIKYDVPVESFIEIIVYDILGREIDKLVSSIVKAGEHSIEFNGNKFGSGVYFYKLNANNYSEIKKMIFLK